MYIGNGHTTYDWFSESPNFVVVHRLRHPAKDIARASIKHFTLSHESAAFKLPPSKQMRRTLEKFLYKKCDFEICGVAASYNPDTHSYGRHLVVMGSLNQWLVSGENRFYISSRDIYGDLVLPFNRREEFHYAVSRNHDFLRFPAALKSLEKVGKLNVMFKAMRKPKAKKSRNGPPACNRPVRTNGSVSPRNNIYHPR